MKVDRLSWRAALAVCAGLMVLRVTPEALAQRPLRTIHESARVNGAWGTEQWRLEWLGAGPSSVLVMEYPGSEPNELSYSLQEFGPLQLTRIGPRGQEESLLLGPYFPSDLHRDAMIRGHQLRDGDFDPDATQEQLFALLSQRPHVHVLEFRDYDRDGQATEFLLVREYNQNVEVDPEYGFVVGISRALPRLHVFSSAERPHEPLVMPVDAWEALASGDPHAVGHTWNFCGLETHTSERVWATRSRETRAWVDAQGIHVGEFVYACRRGSSERGRLLSRP